MPGEVEATERQTVRRSPILFCCAIIAPYAMMWGGVSLALQYIWPEATGYASLNVVLCFVLAEPLITWGLLVAGWLRRERPRWLAIIALVFSISSIWRIFF